MAAKVGGNLGRGSPKPPAPSASPSKPSEQNQPTFWQVMGARLFAAFYLVVAGVGLASGRAVIPAGLYQHLAFIRDQDPIAYWVALAIDAAIGLFAFAYAPYHRWNFTPRFPPSPPESAMDDSYADYKRPPQIIVHPKLPPLRLSDFYEPAFIRSILLLVCFFGAMATAAGMYQLAIGEVYFPNHGTLDVASLQGEPEQFTLAMITYGIIGLLTCGLSAFLYAWRPVRQELSS